MKAKYFFILSGIIGALIGILLVTAITFKVYALDSGKNRNRTTVQCYSGGRLFFSDIIDDREIEINTSKVIMYNKEGVKIAITGDCLITEIVIDENIRKKEEEYFKKSKTRKNIKAELEKDSSQFE